MKSDIHVLLFVNESDPTNSQLELAANVNEEDIQQTICSFYPPDTEPFGVSVESLGGTSQLDPRPYFRLFRYMRREDVDIVHVYPNFTGSVVRLLARFARVDNIVTTENSIHPLGARDNRLVGTLRNFINGSTNWLNDVVICVSETVAESFNAWEDSLIEVSNTEKIVMYSGANLEFIRNPGVDAPVSLPNGPNLGSVGRLVEGKNVDKFIRALGKVAADFPDVSAVIVGDGPQRAELETLAEHLGVRERIHFTGNVERAEVYATLHELDIFAFPSKYEGCPIAAIEAMAAGLPIVANDIKVIREIVGECALYVDASDISSFAEALHQLCNDREKRERFARMSGERAEQFPIQRRAANHVDLYRQLDGR